MTIELFDAIRANLLSPAVLFFVLGLIAALTKSDLKFPEPLDVGMTISRRSTNRSRAMPPPFWR